ncbi:MAG: hypothetical protein WBJ99_03985 [Bacteroidales bacterium]|jgi:hypothetical protein
MKQEEFKKGEIVIYKSPTGPEIQVKLEKDTVWLDAHLIAQLFDVNRPAIVKHINNIYKTGELDKKSTCSILEQVAADGKISNDEVEFEDETKIDTKDLEYKLIKPLIWWE